MSSTKRKSVMSKATLEEINPTPPSSPVDEAEEHENENEAEDTEQPKSKHKHKSKKHKATRPELTAAERAAMMTEFMASMTDEQKADMLQLGKKIPAPYITGSTALTTSLAPAAAETRVAIIEDMEDEEETPFMERMIAAHKKCMPMVRRGLVKVKNPDLAAWMWSDHSKSNIHFMGLRNAKRDILVRRVDQKTWNNETKKMVKTGDKAFININTKFDQRLAGEPLMGYSTMSAFSRTAFQRWGPTAETGVNGTEGKEIKGNKVAPGLEQYQHTLVNKPFNPLMQDESYNNPVMSFMIEEEDKKNMTILAKVAEGQDSISDAKKAIREAIKKGKVDKAVLESGESMATCINELKLFKTIMKADEADPTSTSMGMAVSCYRKPKKVYDGGREVGTEDISKYKEPSSMFTRNMHDSKGNLQIHNRIPLYRCRRADEVVEGEKYDSPFILVPFENAALDSSRDVIATVFHKGFYEWQYDKCGITNKPCAFIWLNDIKSLEKMTLDDIVACDPRYAIPMAGVYRGPLDIAREQEDEMMRRACEVSADGNAVSFVSK